MLNEIKYKDEVLECACSKESSFAVDKDGKIFTCIDGYCYQTKCKFFTPGSRGYMSSEACEKARMKWLKEDAD